MRCTPAVLVSFLASTLLTGCDRSSPEQAHAADAPPAAGASSASVSPADSTAAATEVVATMRRVYDAFVKRDSAVVGAAVRPSGMFYVGADGVSLVTSPGGTTEMVKACTVRSWAMDNVQTSVPAPDIAVLAFKLSIDEVCGGQKSASPDYIVSTWQRQNGAWRAIAFSATPAATAK